MKIRALAREVGAFAQQMRHVHRDWGSSFEGQSESLVVLVHGLYATAGVLRPIRDYLTQRLEVATLTFSHPPGVSFSDIADSLEREIAQRSHHSLHLIGHSLGGLSVLEVLRRRSLSNVRSSATLAAPLEGSPLHRLAAGKAGVDLSSDERMAALQQLTFTAPHLSILAGDDFLIRGKPEVKGARNVVLRDVGHNGLLFDERVKALLFEHIRENSR